MKKKKLLIFGGLAAGVVALIVVKQGAQGDKGTTVRIETVGRENLVATVTASGQIQPKTSVDISADITGRIPRGSKSVVGRGVSAPGTGQPRPSETSLRPVRQSAQSGSQPRLRRRAGDLANQLRGR